MWQRPNTCSLLRNVRFPPRSVPCSPQTHRRKVCATRNSFPTCGWQLYSALCCGRSQKGLEGTSKIIWTLYLTPLFQGYLPFWGCPKPHPSWHWTLPEVLRSSSPVRQLTYPPTWERKKGWKFKKQLWSRNYCSSSRPLISQHAILLHNLWNTVACQNYWQSSMFCSCSTATYKISVKGVGLPQCHMPIYLLAVRYISSSYFCFQFQYESPQWTECIQCNSTTDVSLLNKTFSTGTYKQSI